MTTIVTRAGKGTPLTHAEVDANFTNLNTYKVEQDSNGAIVGSGSPIASGQTITVRNSGTGRAAVQLQNSTSGSTTTDGVTISYDGSFVYIWSYENVPIVFGSNNVERARFDTSGNLLQTGGAGIGFGTGSGGTVTQATSRTTGVTLNEPSGAITLVSAAGSTAWQTFTVTNNTVAATDVPRVVQKSGTDKYMIHVTNVAAGSFQVTFATTGGTTTEQPVFNFAVIKGATA